MEKWKTIIKTAFSQWSDDNVSRLSAATAYYVVFSAAPLLVLIIAVVGLVFEKEAVQGQVAEMLGNYVSPQVATMIQDAMTSVRSPGAGITGSIIGFLILLIAAYWGLQELKSSLNTVWGVTLKEGVAFTEKAKSYLIPFLLIPLLAALLIVLIVGTAIVSAVAQELNFFPGFGYVVQAGNLLVSFGVVMLLFAIIYKTLPDTEISWGDTWVGALITSFLFIAGEFLLSLYLRRGEMGSTYGIAGSLIVFLAWIYYSAQIFYFGAELTEAYSNYAGRKIRPNEEAERLVDTIKRHYHLIEMPDSPLKA